MAVPAMAAAVLAFQPPRWLSAMMVGLPAVIAFASLMVQLREDAKSAQIAQEEERRAWRDGLRQWPPQPMREQDPYVLGVYRSRRARRYQGDAVRPPYVSREIDQRLSELLTNEHQQQFILVTGADWVGKSRTAFEVVQQWLPEHQVLAPWSREGLRELIRPRLADPIGRPAVIWIEDFSSFGVGSLTPTMLEEWSAAADDIRVIATVRKKDLDQLRDALDEHHEELCDVLALVEQNAGLVTIPNTHTGEEHEEIRRLYPNEDVEGCLGDHLFRADRVLDRFLNARGDANDQPGYAVVLACALANLRGLHWVPEALLMEFGRGILTELRPRDATVADYELREGLGFALDDHWRYVTPLLLQQASVEGVVGLYRTRQVIRDYVREHLFSMATTTVTWGAILAKVEGLNLLDVALTAVLEGEDTVAETAWRRALASDQPAVAGRAALELATVAARDGDDQEAERLLVRAMAVEDPDLWPRAARRLGIILAKRGDQAAARATFELVGRSNYPDERLRALRHLGALEFERGDLHQAQQLLQLVIASDHYDAAPRAKFDLGNLLEQTGRHDEAQAAYLAAFESSHPAAAPAAAWRLAVLFATHGDAKHAEAWHQRAATAWGRDVSLADQIELAQRLEEAGRREQADAIFRRIGNATDATLAATARTSRSLPAFMATVEIGRRLLARDEPLRAAEMFRRAIAIESRPPHPDTEARAREGLIDALGRVVSTRDPASTSAAAVELGRLQLERGATEDATKAFTVALDFDDKEHTSRAAFELAELARARGDKNEQLDLLNRVVSLRHEELAPQAAIQVAQLHRYDKNFDLAESALAIAKSFRHATSLRDADDELRALRTARLAAKATNNSGRDSLTNSFTSFPTYRTYGSRPGRSDGPSGGMPSR
jgi:tetratricopeptide (TPR) repeat protein